MTTTKEQELEREIKERETLCIGEQKAGGIWIYTDILKAELKGIKEGKLQEQKRILEIIDELTKMKYYIHLVDECDCCMNGLARLQELKQQIQEQGK